MSSPFGSSFARHVGTAALVALVAACGEDASNDPTPGGGSATPDVGPVGGAPSGGVMADAGPGGAPFLDVGPSGGAPPPPDPEGGEFTVEVLHEERVTLSPGGVSPDITFDVPDDAVAFTIFGLGERPTDYFVVEHLENAEGEAFVTEDPGVPAGPFDQFLSPWPGQFRSPNRAAPSEAMATLLFPNNPELAVTPGQWTLRVASLDPNSGRPGAGEVLVSVRVKRAAQPPQRGVLKLNLYFTGARGWTADTALQDPDFNAALDRMREFYEPIGVDVVPASFTDIPNEYATIDSFMAEAGNELAEMFALGETDQGVNLFFVDRFGGQFGGQIGGIAGAVPGPSGALLGGTPRSGVAVGTSIAPDPRSIGHVMGHETGHYLGLFHTSEIFAQGVNDPIPDTPQGQQGTSNLMYPTVTPEDAELSAQQGVIVRGNPTILPIEVTP